MVSIRCYWLTIAVVFLFATTISSHDSTYSICDKTPCYCDGFGRVFCNCTRTHEEIIIRPDGPYKMLETATNLFVTNCTRVKIMKDAFKDLLEIRTVKLCNIDNLMLTDNSFYWYPDNKYVYEVENGMQIVIENTTILSIPPFTVKGRVDNIFLTNVNIDTIDPFAISTVMEVKRIEIKDSTIKNFKTQAFKKFNVVHFIIKNNTFTNLASRALSDLVISKSFIFSDNRVKKIESNFVRIGGMKQTYIENNNIELTESEAFKIMSKGAVSVNNNYFNELKSKVFLGIKTYDEIQNVYGLMNFEFKNNTIDNYKLDSLVIDTNSFKFISKDIFLNKDCDCNLKEFSMYSERNDLYCKYTNELYHSLKEFKRTECESGKLSASSIIIIIVISVLIAFGIILGLILFFIKKIRKNRMSKLSIVKPEAKTYRQTELYVVVEKADLLTTDL